MQKLENIPIENLLLDVQNPRIHGSISDNITQIELAAYIYKYFGISDLKDSILKNGYFPVEPMIAIPDENKSNKFIVVEGNRRLTAIKILCFEEFRNMAISIGLLETYTASEERKETLENIPVVMAENRDAVNAYIGVRHLGGVVRWGPLAQSKYVYTQIISKKKANKSTVQESINAFIEETSNKKNDVLSHFYKYSIYKYMQRLIEEDSSLNANIDNKFSFLNVAFGKAGRTSIAKYIGIESYKRLNPEDYKDIIPEENEKQTKNFIKWVFSENPPIAESREINKYLKPILKNEASRTAFENGEDKDSALLLSDTYDNIIRKSCKSVHKSLTDIQNNWGNIKPDSAGELVKEYKFKVVEKVTKVNNTVGV